MKTEKPTPVDEFMFQEAESTYQMFKNDREKLQSAMDARKKQIDTLQSEQNTDLRKFVKIDGAISALHHLVTTYRNAWAKSKERKRPRRRKP